MSVYRPILYAVFWSLGLIAALKLIQELTMNIHEQNAIQYSTESNSMLILVYFLLGLYLSLLIVNVFKFTVKPSLLIGAVTPLCVIFLLTHPKGLGLGVLAALQSHLELISILIGFTLMISVFAIRKELHS